MSNFFFYLAAALFGATLEATRRWTIEQNKAEIGAGNGDDVGKFRSKLLFEHRDLKAQKDEWQRKYYVERDLRLKAEWQLEALLKLKADMEGS